MSLNLDKSFNFTKGTRRAVLLLSLLIIALIFVNREIQNFAPPPSDNKAAAEKIDSFLSFVDSTSRLRKKTTHKKVKEKIKVVRLHPFNPNTSGYNDLISLGFSVKQANTILKYLERGGQFRYKEDFKKIRCISQFDFSRIEPYLLLPEKPATVGDSLENNTMVLSLELNSADISDLLEIKGIGPYLARNILKYKQMLGGYYSVSQLLEVYGIDTGRYQEIKDYFTVNEDSVKKRNINAMDFYSLKRHPYISKMQAFEISNHIKYQSKFHSLEELKQLKSVKNSDYEKICHYFVVE